MESDTAHYSWSRHEPPLDGKLVAELIPFWEDVFGGSFRNIEPVLRGSEIDANTNVVYGVCDGEDLAGTCQLTHSRADPRLGGLGEVAVPERFRRHGFATKLCEQARDEFFDQAGDALFLGTVNPAARRIYERLGWRQLPNSTVMVCGKSQVHPDHFLAQWFADASSPVTLFEPNGYGIRVPLIPLALAPHSWQVLDANVGLLSTSCAVQNSCMGLYPRYSPLHESGVVFAAWTADKRLVGLSTARRDGEGCAQVDGFAHANFAECWNPLMKCAIDWAMGRCSGGSFADVAVEDEAKRAEFESIGFAEAGSGEDIVSAERRIKTKRFRFAS
jgi:GNAT superfamily N-acetyltransferase